MTDLSTAVEGGIRFFHFVAREQDAGRLDALDLPEAARVIVLTRDGDSVIAGDDDKLRQDDRVLVVTRQDQLEKLRKRFNLDA